jgi:quercetin dioxygenase-like cupin family protein
MLGRARGHRRPPGALTAALATAAAGVAVFLGFGLLLSALGDPKLTDEIEHARCSPTPAGPARQFGETAKENVMRRILVAAAAIAMAGSVLAHDAATPDGAKELAPQEIVFKDDPAFPNGGQTALLHGDPNKPGLFILRIKFPPNYVVPPHTHPGFETVTVLSGAMGSGMGEKADLTKGKMLKAGGILALPANHAHYVWTADEETIIQVAAIGPFDLVYINPADDPRKK